MHDQELGINPDSRRPAKSRPGYITSILLVIIVGTIRQQKHNWIGIECKS
jgi:hypothetical protein